MDNKKETVFIQNSNDLDKYEIDDQQKKEIILSELDEYGFTIIETDKSYLFINSKKIEPRTIVNGISLNGEDLQDIMEYLIKAIHLNNDDFVDIQLLKIIKILTKNFKVLSNDSR